ncbi:FecR domain-containing protein [Haloferula sp.]|uniref:FecR domain-containing protein n=1 Tax=Haloferula sp. TaxID=2497595 RepID=UPI003C7677E5
MDAGLAQGEEGGKFVVVENQVDRSPAKTAWVSAKTGDQLKWSEQIRTGELSQATLELSTGGLLRVSEYTSLRLQPPPKDRPEGKSRIDFASGVAYFFSRSEQEANIETPTASLNIRGTEFVVEVGRNGETTVSLFDGAVELRNALGAIDLVSGEQGIVSPGRAPRKTAMLDASDRIQWFLYYPGIVDASQFSGLGGAWKRSVAAYAQGDLLEALELLPGNPSAAEQFRFSAVVKLASGRIDAVEADLARGGQGEISKALRGLIDVVKTPAAELGEMDLPATPAGLLARSYALQSQTDLEGALEAAREATAIAPEFGFAWARVADLEFSFGRNEQAIEAINRALELTPKNAQAISLKGYLEMSLNRIAEAQQYFSAAIEIDPALANAWLGRGLAFYQSDDPRQALRAITIAAALEPNRSFLRSYLGKAFAEAHLNERAANEFRLARSLDPGDPTAPFYQALFDQRTYRYNAAVENLEEAIELNGNRAVYRSDFLLDKDRSVREANLASLYENVGMIETSLEEARRSVVSDYLNPSAHLFLSNSINSVRDPRRVSLRNETPWFNELLIANLLSPAGTDLLPQNISQQEYTALFPVRPYRITNRTLYRGDGELLTSGTLQASFGQTSVALDYDTFNADGFRPNQDVERYTGYLQLKHALTERDSLYFNFKFQKSSSGDLRQLYDQTTYDPDFRVEQKQAPVAIVGYQHEWSPGSRTLALGGVLTDRLEISNRDVTSIARFTNPLGPPTAFTNDLSQVRETEVYFGELQHIWNDENDTLIVGARFDGGQFPTTNIFSNPQFGFIYPGDPYVVTASPGYQRFVAYTYYTREIIPRLWVTAGLAFDHQEFPLNTSLAPVSDISESQTEILPKSGIVWSPVDAFTMRLGYTRSLGGVTFDESVRLEPTQVAGFTQSFRTLINESEVGGLPAPLFDTAGISFDWELPCRTYLGLEGFQRTAEAERAIGVFPIPNAEIISIRENLDYSEWGMTAHVNQLIGDQWAVGARYTFTHAELESDLVGFSPTGETDLHDLEAYLIWNHPNGWFGQLSGRMLSQDNVGYTVAQPGDCWTQFDVSLGRRFFNNRGSLEVGILNFTDQDYQFNPLITQAEQPRERTFFVEARLDF